MTSGKHAGDGAISDAMRETVKGASFIRQAFEEGVRLKRELGEDRVFDLSLGNPSAPPPPEVFAALRECAAESRAEDHRYMTNAGRLDLRTELAQRLSRQHGMALGPEHVVMTCGAAGGLNVLLKSVLDPGDEVIVLVPYFPEYLFYIQNHGGRPRAVPCDADFQPDLAAIEAALGPRTRAIIVNTPNNPSGVVYAPERVEAIGRLIDAHSDRIGRPVYLFSDEPYRRVRYVPGEHPSALRCSRHGFVVTSYSKELGLAGERIGYVVLNPRSPGIADLFAALGIATRILGFVNAPAFMQRVIRRCADALVDLGSYRENRDILWQAMTAAGYEMPHPDGAFFLFPAVPGGDDIAFCRALKEKLVLVVPGTGFGCPGRFRVSYAVPRRVVEAAAPLFAAVRQDYART